MCDVIVSKAYVVAGIGAVELICAIVVVMSFVGGLTERVVVAGLFRSSCPIVVAQELYRQTEVNDIVVHIRLYDVNGVGQNLVEVNIFPQCSRGTEDGVADREVAGQTCTSVLRCNDHVCCGLCL